MATISLRGVEKLFSGHPQKGSLKTPKLQEQAVLKGITMEIKSGEFVAIMGPSGCGKSTLLNVCGGLETPTRGEVVIDGSALHTFSQKQRDAFRLNTVAYVFQFFHLLPTLSLLENVLLPAYEKKPKEKSRTFEKARQLMETSGLLMYENYYPSQVSGGMLQRTALLRALLCEPKLLLADEPTGNLDTKNGAMVLDLIKVLHEQTGATVLLVTHDEMAAGVAQKRIYLKDGLIEKTVNQQT